MLRFPASVWRDPAPVASAERRLTAIPQFDSFTGPLHVNGITFTPGRLTRLHAAFGPPGTVRTPPPAGSGIGPATWAAYRAESQFISPDGRTVLFDAGLTADPPDSNAALRQVPAIRAAVTAAARAVGARAYGVTGQAPVGYDVGQAAGGSYAMKRRA